MFGVKSLSLAWPQAGAACRAGGRRCLSRRSRKCCRRCREIFAPQVERHAAPLEPYRSAQQGVQVLPLVVGLIPVYSASSLHACAYDDALQPPAAHRDGVVGLCKDSVLRGVGDNFFRKIFLPIVKFDEPGVCMAVTCSNLDVSCGLEVEGYLDPVASRLPGVGHHPACGGSVGEHG